MMPLKHSISATYPNLVPCAYLLVYIFLFLLLLIPPNTAQAPAAAQPFPFPVLPQEFASKTACREVYDQCMQAFRDCLAAVGGNESGRLGCEAYRNDVCEEHIRVGCDQLPNGGGSIGEVTPPSLTTFLTVVPIADTTEEMQVTATATTRKKPPKTSTPLPAPTDAPTPTPDPPDPTLTPTLTQTTSLIDRSIIITTTTTPQQQQPPRSTITLTSTATESTSGSQTIVVITTVVAAITGPVTSETVTRGLSFSVVSSGTRWECEWWTAIVIMGMGLGFVGL